ncbi:MAG: bifunctional alpha,alpha-trehalose-phosphate synthase (UDP-forming)/trehalose-phosphatase [Myxococcota bacterium]
MNGDRPLVVASNRLPFTLQRTRAGLQRNPSPGGLVSALEPVLRARGGTWIGWPGIALEPDEPVDSEDGPYRVKQVQLSETEINRYYHGFSNRTLWPLFHSMPGIARFDRLDYQTYDRVNSRFAEAIAEHAAAAGLVWIHDYQLLLAPAGVREHAPQARLAFFLHIPFPPYDIFRLLPWDRELLRGMLGCDLIGFHVPGYALNFLDCVERRLGSRVDRENLVIEHGDRAVQVGIFPIGIEFDLFAERAGNGGRGADNGAGRNGSAQKVVLGVDRLDYTKGIPERISAFERLLELHPEHREKVVLLQVAVPSRSQVAEYRALKREIDELVGQVNGRFATATWSPIRYLYRSLSQEKLASIYRDADVALVTPLRDGMNLVAKEYVASQVDDPGVLVLSSLAGAAETMREALPVNPYDLDRTAETIHRALTMGSTERRSRMAALRKRERRDDVHTWVRSFLDAAASSQASLHPVGAQDFEHWLGPYLTRPVLAMFVDYDGTLCNLVSDPSDAVMDPGMRKALRRCFERPDTDVAVISGRALADVRRLVGIDDMTYAGNHGLQISGGGIPDFVHEDLKHYAGRTDSLADQLAEVAIDGAWTEAKGPTLTYHFRAVPPNRRSALVERARTLITQAGFQARDAHCALEARPPIGWDKGRAVLSILRARYGLSWSERVRVIYVGDDHTDEDAFRFLSGLSATFRVGPANTETAASRRLPDVGSVRTLLEWLADRPPFEGGESEEESA